MLQSFKEYLVHEKKCSPSTLQSYMTDLSQFEHFYREMYQPGQTTEVAVHTAQPQDVRAWIATLIENKMNSRSVNRKLASLRAFFRYAEQQGLTTKSPVARIKPLKTKRPLPLFVREAAMYKLLEEMSFGEDYEGQRDRLIIELLYGTGLRLSELINLKKTDISFAEATITVTGKKDLQKNIPLHDQLLDFLKKFVDLNPYEYLITTAKGEQAYPMLIYRAVRRLLNQVNLIERKNPQALRHTFTTHLLSKGADLNALGEIMGQNSLNGTQVYAHNALEKLKRVFEQAHPKA